MSTPEQQLAAYRQRIDALDDIIAKALVERCGVVRQVAELKTEHWPSDCHIRSGREGQMHRAVAERFQHTDVAPVAALAIWRQFIGAATNLESPLCVAVLESHPHHYWLAREYFGAGAQVRLFNDLPNLVRAMDMKECNIALLAAPVGNAWPEAAVLHARGLALFASLPVTAAPDSPFGGAIAFARITPEPSGDDVSYFLENGTLSTRDGFIDADASAIFLGAHPRPITLANSPREGESNPLADLVGGNGSASMRGESPPPNR